MYISTTLEFLKHTTDFHPIRVDAFLFHPVALTWPALADMYELHGAFHTPSIYMHVTFSTHMQNYGSSLLDSHSGSRPLSIIIVFCTLVFTYLEDLVIREAV